MFLQDYSVRRDPGLAPARGLAGVCFEGLIDCSSIIDKSYGAVIVCIAPNKAPIISRQK